MLLKMLLCLLCGARALAAENAALPPPLLLLSFDGFRADYLERFPMPNLKHLYSQGVLVEQLTNVFITKTFPNHYSLVTGLYAESHGMLASTMYDPATHKHFHAGKDMDPMWWSEGKPLWITAQESGYKTAAAMWPGSDVTLSNRTATHFFPYNSSITFQERLGKVINWIKGDEKEQGVMFAAIYYEEPDRSGHLYGPDNTTAMSKALKEVDDHIGLVISELTRTGLWGHIHVLITSDHGMAQCSPERLIRLDDCLHPDNYTLVDLSPATAILPRADTETVFNLLHNCHANMTAFLKKDIPDRLHYRNNERIQPIILIADEGWTIVQRGDKLPRLGDHGYDNSLTSMHPFLAATGPRFLKAHRISTLQSVDIYPLMCHLLSVPAQPNNGSLTRARSLLTPEASWDVPVMIGLVMGVLIVLSTITLMFWLLRCRHPSAPTPFQRLQVDMYDNENLLE